MKSNRHQRIIELINEHSIETQEELASRLQEEGYRVTQATVSRDIRELHLVKAMVDGVRQRYVLLAIKEEQDNTRFVRVLRDGFVSMDMAQNILVIKTVSGMAMAVAAALDSMHFEEIVGNVAGDDTIMCAVRTVEDTIIVIEKLKKLIDT